MQSLGSQIRAERNRRGLTITEIAEVSGCSPTMISMLERSQRSIVSSRAGALLSALGLRLVIVRAAAGGDLPSRKLGRDGWTRLDPPAWVRTSGGYVIAWVHLEAGAGARGPRRWRWSTLCTEGEDPRYAPSAAAAMEAADLHLAGSE